MRVHRPEGARLLRIGRLAVAWWPGRSVAVVWLCEDCYIKPIYEWLHLPRGMWGCR